jgi:hypothetical protein
MYFGFYSFSPYSILVSVLPFALFGIGLTQRTQSPFLRTGSRAMD